MSKRTPKAGDRFIILRNAVSAHHPHDMEIELRPGDVITASSVHAHGVYYDIFNGDGNYYTQNSIELKDIELIDDDERGDIVQNIDDDPEHGEKLIVTSSKKATTECVIYDELARGFIRRKSLLTKDVQLITKNKIKQGSKLKVVINNYNAHSAEHDGQLKPGDIITAELLDSNGCIVYRIYGGATNVIQIPHIKLIEEEIEDDLPPVAPTFKVGDSVMYFDTEAEVIAVSSYLIQIKCTVDGLMVAVPAKELVFLNKSFHKIWD